MTESHKRYRESDPTKDPRIAEEIAAGEELVWAGRPVVMLRLKDAARGLPFGLVCAGLGGYTLYWTVTRVFFGDETRSDSHVGGIVLLASIGFVAALFSLVGLLLILYPLFDLHNAKREVFAITTERCIVWYGSRVISYRANDLKAMYRDMDSRGRGALWLGVDPIYAAEDPEDQSMVGFCGIERVREIEQLIRETLHVPEESVEEEAS